MFRKLLFGSLILTILVAAGCSALNQVKTIPANPAVPPAQADPAANPGNSDPAQANRGSNNSGRANPGAGLQSFDYAQSSVANVGSGNRYGQQGNRGAGSSGQGTQNQQQTYTNLPAPAASLSQDEIDGLLFMREEEKLARDVYNALYAAWGLPVFQSIAQSEQTHMDAVMNLLDRYGLPDPASSEPGVFNNPALQALYDQLVAQGRQSIVAALQAGAAIEEIDILDLQEQLTLTAAADIQQIYTNLLRGSENHLKAFVANLSSQGVAYTPQYLTPEAYQAILSGTSGNGRGAQGGNGHGGNNRP